MNKPSNHSQRHFLQNELLTVREVADYLRISRVTAWRWCQEGIIPAFRIGRSWRIHRDELLKLQETCGSDHHGKNLEVS
jgi:excisionase family DNA binding protein